VPDRGVVCLAFPSNYRRGLDLGNEAIVVNTEAVAGRSLRGVLALQKLYRVL
jgi:hypothetical protein